MRTLNEALDKAWELHDRGIITQAEIVNQFWGEIVYLDGDTVETFCRLPERTQLLIAESLQRIPPENMQSLLYIGDITENQIREESTKRQVKAKAIASYLANQPQKKGSDD